MAVNCLSWKWRISLTEAGLDKGSFHNYGIPAPDTGMYTDSTTAATRSDGSQSLHGYRQVTLSWGRLTALQLAVIREFIDDARSGAGLLYLTIDRGDGSAPGRDWIDVFGKPHRQPQLTQEGPIGSSIGQPSYQNVRLFVNDLTVVNDPSSYS